MQHLCRYNTFLCVFFVCLFLFGGEESLACTLLLFTNVLLLSSEQLRLLSEVVE